MTQPRASDAYGVRIDGVNFEGPLDLLLFLIEKNEIDVTDIPIARVTEQFLGYLERITAEDLEAAGEFLLMAATLLRIKARMLLPPVEGDLDEPLEDPRSELVARLLEYQQYKRAARTLREREEQARLVYARGFHESAPDREAASPAPERRVSLNDLLQAFAAVLAVAAARAPHHIEPLEITLEEKLLDVRAALAERGDALFSDLFPSDASRLELVVTLIALLEMVRNGEVRLVQEGAFGEIHVVACPPADSPEVEGPGAPGSANGANDDVGVAAQGERGRWTPS